jgi:hypothetical protein
MTSWFSATAITPELRDTWRLSEPFLVWLTNGVQIGFVMGALALSLVNLPDIIRLNRLMAASAAMAAVANASLLSASLAMIVRQIGVVALNELHAGGYRLSGSKGVGCTASIGSGPISHSSAVRASPATPAEE